MEYGVDRLKVVLAGVVLCLAAVLAATAPALAQDDDVIDDDSVTDIQYGDNIQTGDINAQVCQNIIGDINAGANQYNSGDQIAIGDGNVQAIAQEQNVSVNVVQQCIQLLNGDGNGGDGGATPPETTSPETTSPETTSPETTSTDSDESMMATLADDTDENKDDVIASTIPPKVLANTGGATAALTLLPAALLVAFGATMLCIVSWRR